MMLTPTELFQAISRVRRAMPRNSDVMAICDAAEATKPPPPNPGYPPSGTVLVKGFVTGPKFNKKAYQRDLMRKRRAEDKRRRQAEAKA